MAKKSVTKPKQKPVRAVKKAPRVDLTYRVTEVYVRISLSNGLDKDTLAHGAVSAQEAIEFITKNT